MVWRAVVRGYFGFSGLFFAVLLVEAEKCWYKMGTGGTSEGPLYPDKF